MPVNSSSDQRITRELYEKNLDLVNANKTLELIRELYQTAIENNSVESISQKFIDTIVSRLGFADGMVLVLDDKTNRLKVTGITEGQLNRTVLDITGLREDELSFSLTNVDNDMVKAVSTGTSRVVKGVIGVWMPLIKSSDLAEISSLDLDVTFLINPIIINRKVLGVFVVSLLKNVKNLTEFEKSVLGRITSVFGIALDRTKVSEELKKAQESEVAKAKELVKLKDEFVFIASHDLRTPVTAIRGFVEMIKDRKEPMSAAAQEDFREVEIASERLNQLINDLLEVARSESGTIKVATLPVSSACVIENAVSLAVPQAETKGIKIVTKLAEDTKMVLADSVKLAEVVENLISNGIKYNKEGGTLTITSSVVPGNMASFSFADTGYGISKDKQEKVFQKFYRARQEGTEDVQGTGLGLFLVRMLIEKMNGEIAFESKEGVGSTFTFTLPLAI
jgi:signal transduction histidine kinase